MMRMDICNENIVVQLDAPHGHSLPLERMTVTNEGRVQATTAVVELGRRLLQAARVGDTPTVLELMAQGAPFTTDWLGTSPLHLAAQNGHEETCAVLLRAGIGRDTCTKVERTPLHLAAYEGHSRVAEILLQHGAHVDCRDMLQMSPLHWAVERGHLDCARVLLVHGADPNCRSKFNKTPTTLAEARDCKQMNKIISEAIVLRDKDKEKEIKTRGNNQKDMRSITCSSEVHKSQEPLRQDLRQEKARVVGVGGEALGAQVLRRHGITLLPTDDDGTVLSALRSGRTVVLSDAGKLVLRESGDNGDTSDTGNTSPSTCVSSTNGVGNTVQLVSLDDNNDIHNGQVKLVRVSSKGGSIVSTSTSAPVVTPSRASGVRILLRKNSLRSVNTALPQPPSTSTTASKRTERGPTKVVGTQRYQVGGGGNNNSKRGCVVVPERVLRSNDPEWLRSQLLAAYSTIARLRQQLRLATNNNGDNNNMRG